MAESYDLTKLDTNSFEHLVNLLALRVLGAGHTGFGPGSDAGRDGYFEGEAPYPSEKDRWAGRWYIQSKFHKPHLSKDPQKWLLDCIKEEIKEFKKPDSKRKWPDNWIIATNIDPSGAPMTGAFDQAKRLVSKAHAKLKNHFHIWGGCKILNLLSLHPEVGEQYRHFLTPGHILTAIYNQIHDAHAEAETILRFLIVTQFSEQQHTKLEQAGSTADTRPGIHHLFIDLPFRANEYDLEGMSIEYLVRAAARCHRIDEKQPDSKGWKLWRRHPSRARVWFVKGGPGQGKSTIAQYFCQILRASLILQTDSPKVVAPQKTIANEIRKVAEKAGVWPRIPRIPISIELKEFAHWFGQQGKNAPRGVLTYLAERISAGVEQKVHVGTLKRLLQSHSWFVVFDGLDEVPHDVKDAVASEVRNFVDNVVIEANADLLTFCTSRPQGYSGQFSDLDGPTIELTNLLPEQALRCAKPVLKLDRPEEEAKKSFEILKSAIQSSSVKELMTTPLQSHIMAVVVRDGGRPPDRRWQLFNNFYQVMKKREANKNSPDKRLAKLLREKEQLLMTVHNRLGFVLHARAETSEGAQTNLNRDEFKVLVEKAVSQMMEERDVVDTVNVLMNATTERLVLVSTPDDGSHVRFHIRQLQEFFAAEFLYESVDADELRRRIECVAGDSHWHEVMHFLMSALVENKRRTELAVAIDVLERLNEGDGDPHVRLLCRRLGRGSLLAARLLQEGVFEEDKRVREQFRKCLEPLTASTDLQALKSLLLVNQPDSQSWLLNFLNDSLKDAHLTENIGAAIVLAHILPDDDERVERLKSFFLASPPEFISFVLDLRAPRPHSEVFTSSAPIKKWFLDTTLKLLLQPVWTSLGIAGIRSAIEILSHDKKETLTIAKENGLPAIQIELLRILLEQEPAIKQKWNAYGFLNGSHFQHDWTTASFAFKSLTTESLEGASQSPGILQLVYRVLRFAKTQNFSDFCSLLDNFDDQNTQLINILPRQLCSYIPIDRYLPLEDQFKTLKSLNEKQFEILLQKQQINSYRFHRPFRELMLNEQSNTIDQWKTTVEYFPSLALHLWSESMWLPIRARKRPEVLDTKEAVNALIDTLLQSPNILLANSNLWGRLLNKASTRQLELRRAFLIAASRPVEQGFWGEQTHPFNLDLPSEAIFLPHLINCLMNLSQFRLRERDFEKQLKELGQFIHEYVNDNSLLEQIGKNPSMGSNTRAAAVLMSLLHPKGNKDLSSKQHLLVEFYDPQIGSWYLRAIRISLTFLATEKDPIAKSIIGKLLDAARSDYKGRQELQQLLALWRESSYAPVQTAGVQEEWLAGK